MPRRTHPRPQHGHSRAQLRQQRERWIQRRWRQLKDAAQADTGPQRLHPEEVRKLARQLGPDGQLPEPVRWSWPLNLADNQLARNPRTHCSCALCRPQASDRRARRRREARAWRRDWGL